MFAKYFTHTQEFTKYYIHTEIISGFFHLIISLDAKMESILNKNTGSSGSGVGFSVTSFDYLWGLIFLGYPMSLLAEHIL